MEIWIKFWQFPVCFVNKSWGKCIAGNHVKYMKNDFLIRIHLWQLYCIGSPLILFYRQQFSVKMGLIFDVLFIFFFKTFYWGAWLIVIWFFRYCNLYQHFIGSNPNTDTFLCTNCCLMYASLMKLFSHKIRRWRFGHFLNISLPSISSRYFEDNDIVRNLFIKGSSLSPGNCFNWLFIKFKFTKFSKLSKAFGSIVFMVLFDNEISSIFIFRVNVHELISSNWLSLNETLLKSVQNCNEFCRITCSPTEST